MAVFASSGRGEGGGAVDPQTKVCAPAIGLQCLASFCPQTNLSGVGGRVSGSAAPLPPLTPG